MPWIFKARRVDEMMRKKKGASMPDLLFLTLFGTDSSKIELGPRRYQYFQELYLFMLQLFSLGSMGHALQNPLL